MAKCQGEQLVVAHAASRAPVQQRTRGRVRYQLEEESRHMSLPLLFLVDDAPDIGLIVRHLGRRAGYRLEHCADGESAWECLQNTSRDANGRPALVLLDYHLPGCDGAEWCRRIRAVPEWADIATALFSHWTQASDLLVALEAGTDYVLSKELLSDVEAWHSRLDEILNQAGDRLRLSSWENELGGSPAASAADWDHALTQALQHPTVRHLGTEVLRVLCRRAVQCLHLPDSLATQSGLDFTHIPPAERPAAAAAVTKQIACVFGVAGSAPFRAALTAALVAPAGGVARP